MTGRGFRGKKPEHLFVQFGEDLENDGAENQQHAAPDHQHANAATAFAKVEANGQQQHAANNRNHHGVERSRFEHGDGPEQMNTSSLGRFAKMCADVYQK